MSRGSVNHEGPGTSETKPDVGRPAVANLESKRRKKGTEWELSVKFHQGLIQSNTWHRPLYDHMKGSTCI